MVEAISWTIAVALILPISCIGAIFSIVNFSSVKKIRPEDHLGLKKEGAKQPLVVNEEGKEGHQSPVEIMCEMALRIQQGANTFLKSEYKFCIVWCILQAVVIFFAVDQMKYAYSTVSFLVGAFTSIISGYIAMHIATQSNYRTTFTAYQRICQGESKGDAMAATFKVAYQAGCAMGFILVSIALAVLTILIAIYFKIVCEGDAESPRIPFLMEVIAGYGLGGSTVALFGRVGGGIYTKAADVGADLVGKVEESMAEDSPKNPATVADNVGDNVGDVAGMGSDLFGSFAESSCAALVVSGASLTPVGGVLSINYLWYPLLVTAFGILVCIFTAVLGINCYNVSEDEKIEATLKHQLLISSILLTPVIIGIAYWAVPAEFTLNSVKGVLGPKDVFICTLVGLYAGLVIGYITEYMTSHSYSPVRDVVKSCETGAATNIIYGLALGYNSTIVPIISIMIAAYVSHKLCGFYGVALAALGMLSNLPVGLAIDGYGPISDNAGGLAEMALEEGGDEEMANTVRDITDALDAAGNTTAAIGKGFAIGSAALVSLALYGGFITRVREWTDGEGNDSRHGLITSEIIDPLIFAGLLLGAMLPYAFSAFTMKSVGKAAKGMVEEIRRQLRENPKIKQGLSAPDYNRCIDISTQESLKEMVAPGILVVFTPIIFGLLFGPKGLAGMLPGSLVSGVQMAISSANTGGAWDNTKKYIEGGHYKDSNGVVQKKKSEIHKAAVIGDTVGDPLKDTSGPSLNILVKLMAILSLVFAEFFCITGFLVVPFHDY